MSCVFSNCPEKASSLCICKKTSFFCESHSSTHKSVCRSLQVNIKSGNNSKPIQQKLSNLKSSIKSASSLLIQTIESMCENFISELGILEICIESELSVPEISIKSEQFEAIKELIQDYLGISNFSLPDILANDFKIESSQEVSCSTFESSGIYEPKNPVGIFLEKEDGLAWLMENGLEFDADQIYEITVNNDRSLGYLCEG